MKKLSATWFTGVVIGITPQRYRVKVLHLMWPFCDASMNRSLARIKYWQAIDRQVNIRWAYDGALGCGRDQEWWLEKSFNNLTCFMSAQVPPHFKIGAILDHPDSPKLLKAKIYTVLWINFKYREARDDATWKWCLLSALTSVLMMQAISPIQ